MRNCCYSIALATVLCLSCAALDVLSAAEPSDKGFEALADTTIGRDSVAGRFTRFGLRDADVEGIVRSQDVVYENAATCWQDGHILGNGDLGAVAYAPIGSMDDQQGGRF